MSAPDPEPAPKKLEPKPEPAKPPPPPAAGATAAVPVPKAVAVRPKVVSGPPGEKKPVLVLPTSSRRETLFTVVIVIVVVTLIGLAVYQMGTETSPNLLIGTVTEKYVDAPELGVSTKGVKTVDSGFHLKVRVGDRQYLIKTLPEEEWNRYKVGDTIKFLKPPEEQH